MSDIRLDSARDVELFLKILAEESVREAQRSVSSIDPMQSQIEKQVKQDKSIYDLREQDGPPSGEDEVAKPAEDSEAGAEAETETGEDDSGEGLEVSLDSVADSIKTLRSGRSVDDREIKAQMRAYFDRLDAPERQALQAFMGAFAKILTSNVTGADAQDPSDPPLNIAMSGDEPEPQGTKAAAQEEEPVATEPTEEEEEEEEEDEKKGAEDTTPPVPITPGGPQRVAEIRRRVQKLMIR